MVVKDEKILVTMEIVVEESLGSCQVSQVCRAVDSIFFNSIFFFDRASVLQLKQGFFSYNFYRAGL